MNDAPPAKQVPASLMLSSRRRTFADEPFGAVLHDPTPLCHPASVPYLRRTYLYPRSGRASAHCGPERKMEYGVAGQPDYKGRGAKAGAYTSFVFNELLPHIHETYNVPSFKEKSFAGFSMGGLSAFDIVWNHSYEFANVGVFSGSLWWRSKGYMEDYDDNKHRIMHQNIKNGEFYPWLKFFFECGILDEKADRNHNGVIDAIDDTLDLIKELKKKGYAEASIKYLELEDGKHDVPTWARAFPNFLEWGWPKM